MFLAPLALAACGSDDDKAADSGLTDPNAELNAELDGLIDGYESWPQVEAGIVPSAAVHGEYVQNWLNDTAKTVVDAQAGEPMPDGSVLVKQGYDDELGDSEKNLTVMWKTDGEWFWAQYSNTGDLSKSGFELEGCVECHEGDAGQQDGGVITYDW
jgi:hypothetical protein